MFSFESFHINHRFRVFISSVICKTKSQKTILICMNPLSPEQTMGKAYLAAELAS